MVRPRPRIRREAADEIVHCLGRCLPRDAAVLPVDFGRWGRLRIILRLRIGGPGFDTPDRFYYSISPQVHHPIVHLARRFIGPDGHPFFEDDLAGIDLRLQKERSDARLRGPIHYRPVDGRGAAVPRE